MTTISILPITDESGNLSYRAISAERNSEGTAGNQQTIGKTAGQALDALLLQLGQSSSSLSLLIQTFQPDPFFTAAQQQRLSELMELWRTARDQGQLLSPQEQAELDALVNAELQATQQRLNANMQLPSHNS
jgi:hypothetical protein